MLDRLLSPELMAAWKRSELDRRVEDARILFILDPAPMTIRGAIAAAIVRFGICVDRNAGRRAAASHDAHETSRAA